MGSTLGEIDIELIRKTALFSNLSSQVLARLIAESRVQTANAGETLFVQGDPVSACFIVLEGWVKIYRLTPGGNEAIVAVFTRGQSFAEAALFSKQEYPVTGESVTRSRLLRLPCELLLHEIRTNPEISLAMLASTSIHLQELVQQIEQLKANTGAQRVAEFLTSLCPVDGGAYTVELPYDKSLIAGRVGMKPESLSRAFGRLREFGVNIEKNIAAISDVQRLRDFSVTETKMGQLCNLWVKESSRRQSKPLMRPTQKTRKPSPLTELNSPASWFTACA
jgi:CRP-like cAMP-binding protein